MKGLIIVDVQNDFLPGGALPVPGGFDIIEPILDLARRYGDNIAKTMDRHPEETSHFDLWPPHCVIGTPGARLVQAIDDLPGDVFAKGKEPGEDAYSGFANPDLKDWAEGMDVVRVVGLALDYCVKATALDARALGVPTVVSLTHTRPVTPEGYAAVWELRQAGVEVIR